MENTSQLRPILIQWKSTTFRLDLKNSYYDFIKFYNPQAELYLNWVVVVAIIAYVLSFNQRRMKSLS